MKRREFIILGSVGAASASLLSACGHPEEKLIPAFIPDEDYIPGIDYWKTSTCGMCSAGCGIIVRTREHKANKIEGNPLHPVNRGALCARGQAGLEVLYNPDRIKGPMKRVGERGEGKWEEISWDEAVKEVTDKLREIKQQGRANRIVFATSDLNGVTGVAIRTFVSSYGAQILLTTETPKNLSEASTYQSSYGVLNTPIFDIANATYLLSFGARFLETWHSPVRYSLAYGEFRHAMGRARGRFVQVEPRMSLTAANADEWLPTSVGTEGFVALAMAQVILREKLNKAALDLKVLDGTLEDYAPEKTREVTGIDPDKIIRVAREFASSERPLAICGGAVGAGAKDRQAQFEAINALNILNANVNRQGGVLLSSYSYLDLLRNVRSTLPASHETSLHGARDIVVDDPRYELLSSAQPYSALLIHQMNPVFSNPRTLDTINSIPFIVTFASFMNETAHLADLVLPDHTYLESWNVRTDTLTEKQVAVSITQPAIKPEASSRQAADVVLALAREFDDKTNRIESAEDIVKEIVIHLRSGEKMKPDVKADSSEGATQDGLPTLTQQGFWIGEVAGFTKEFKPTTEVTVHLMTPDVSEEIKEDYPLILLAYEHPALGFGEYANLPVCQELPDPMTSVMWGSWVEINPKTAASLGIADGDVVEVSSYHGSVRAPAVLFPAIRPEVIAMPYGQGHTAYGRYATDKGANPILVNPYAAYSDTSAVRVRVSKVSSGGRVIKFGTTMQEQTEKKR